MRTLAALLASLSLCGCSALASREAAAGCQVADIVTTERALRMNPNAHETNPAPLPALYAIKLALAWFIMTWKEWDQAPQVLRIAVTAVGCAPVPGNLRAAKGGR